MGTMNVCIKCHSNPSDSQDISVLTKVVYRPTDIAIPSWCMAKNAFKLHWNKPYMSETGSASLLNNQLKAFSALVEAKYSDA